ncbi:hypothetical protein KIW84_010729 [Lathyrus oleraceus]|uniref:Uncharacterized protein n=1 Tax=Pisum sativum TaxID=3888 RepID=A0A9D4YNR0_PEA|nr:hypothetical protein KIW84_010729 [Pisum sativum]
MAWNPDGNALAIIDVKGKYDIWDNVIHLYMKSPTKDIPMQGMNINEVLLFCEEDHDISASGNLSELGESSNVGAMTHVSDIFGLDTEDQRSIFLLC